MVTNRLRRCRVLVDNFNHSAGTAALRKLKDDERVLVDEGVRDDQGGGICRGRRKKQRRHVFFFPLTTKSLSRAEAGVALQRKNDERVRKKGKGKKK